MSSWELKAKAKKEAQEKLVPEYLKLKSPPASDVLDVVSIPPESFGVLSELDIEITNITDVKLLLEKLHSGVYTAEQVTRAFSNRAIVAHQLVNCLTEIFIESAIERAKKLDEHFKKTGKPIGPLHGLPISLKEQIDIKGVEMTFGYVGWIGHISESNAVMTDVLIAQGAIPYVRTNIPQALMMGESVNAIFGRTLNPYNRSLTCGGSSGGEGALIALKGSIVGVGSDIGGSVRIPAAFNQLYGLRPSFNRVPYQNATNSMQGQEAVSSVLGPLTNSVDGLKIFMKAVADGKPWLADPICLRMPWNEDAYNLSDHGGPNAKLCFGIMWTDGICNPMPSYTRAMQETKKALEAAGHTVIDWVQYGAAESGTLLHDIFNADGGQDIRSNCELSGEPQLQWLLDLNPNHLSTYEYWQLCHKRLGFIKRQLDHWEATSSKTGTGRPVDAIIAPTSATAPCPHGSKDPYIGYSSFCNLADYVSAVFPVTKVIPEVDKKVARDDFLSDFDRNHHEIYDPQLYKDAPIGLQCIGRKHEEEAVIKMTEIVDAALKKYKVAN